MWRHIREYRPLPMLTMFDKWIQLGTGQANVERRVDDILLLLTDEDPLGVEALAPHRLPLEEGPQGRKAFRDKQDGMIKTLLVP
ncbi:hypothetical protein GCM10027162_22690 [Streptomyces incanus]